MEEFLNGFNIFSPLVIISRLLFAVLAGFLIGLERERHNQPAGLRTHMVLALGACTIMILSIYVPVEYMHKVTNADPGRMAAQVISGIGFLGAGAILRYGFNVKGLTTAASIWTVSGIGLVFGAGFYFLGGVSTVILLVILHLFDRLEDRLVAKRDLRILKIIYESKHLSSSKIIEVAENFDIEIKHTSLIENLDAATSEIEINCKIGEKVDINDLFESLKLLGYIKTLRID